MSRDHHSTATYLAGAAACRLRWATLLGLVTLAASAPPLAASTVTELQTLPSVGVGQALDAAGDFAVSVRSDDRLVLYSFDAPTGMWEQSLLDPEMPLDQAVATDGERIVWVELLPTPVVSGQYVALHGTLRSLTTLQQEIDTQLWGPVLDMDLAGGLLVVALEYGDVETYEWTGAFWQPAGALPATSGSVEAVATDGTRVFIGQPGLGDDGAVRSFRREAGLWVQNAVLEPDFGLLGQDQNWQSDAGFGSSLALAGGCLLVGAPAFDGGSFLTVRRTDAGAVFSYLPQMGGFASRGSLQPEQTLASHTRFGADVAGDDQNVAVGAPDYEPPAGLSQGRVFIFGRHGSGCATDVAWREVFLGTSSFFLDPLTSGELGGRVGVGSTILGADVQAGRILSFPATVFLDGFESGGSSRWSATVP